MHDSRMQKLARNLIRYSCALKKGERILIEAIDIPGLRSLALPCEIVD